MSLALYSPVSRMCRELRTVSICPLDTPFVCACPTRLLICFELASQPSSQFAETENGHCCSKPTRVAPPSALGPAIPQGGAGFVSGASRNSNTDGAGCDSGHDYLHDLSYSLRVRGRDLHIHRFARKPPGHAAISWSIIPFYRNWCSLCLDFRGVCYQRSDPAFSLGHWFVLSDFLCTRRDDQLQRSIYIRHYDCCRRSDMGSPRVSGN